MDVSLFLAFCLGGVVRFGNGLKPRGLRIHFRRKRRFSK